MSSALVYVYVYIYIYIYIKKEYSCNPNSISLVVPTRSVATWPSRRMCYRPTVFFRHVRLVALFFSHNENMARARLKNALQFYFVLFLLLNCVIWGTVYSLHIRATCGVHLYTLWFNYVVNIWGIVSVMAGPHFVIFLEVPSHLQTRLYSRFDYVLPSSCPTISSSISVCIIADPARRISVKFGIGDLHENLSSKPKFC